MMRLDEVVSRDPDILNGTPVFLGTRVPIQSLFDYLEGGETLDEFLRQFPSVRREQAVEKRTRRPGFQRAPRMAGLGGPFRGSLRPE